jgi:hypothetical protein
MCNTTTSLFVRCFGAQAMTCGLVLGTSTMTPFSFTAFGIAMVPYLMWMVFVGNVFFGAGSLYCAKLLREQEEGDKQKGE